MPALQDQNKPTTEDAQLDAALRKADDVLAASLRREEAQRKSRRTWLALIISFLLGAAAGAATIALWPRHSAPAPLTAQSPANPYAPTIPTTGPCEVKWGNEWRKATIINRDEPHNIFQVKYDGWDDFFDEWVIPNRIRPVGSNWNPIGYAKPTRHGEKPTQPDESN